MRRFNKNKKTLFLVLALLAVMILSALALTGCGDKTAGEQDGKVPSLSGDGEDGPSDAASAGAQEAVIGEFSTTDLDGNAVGNEIFKENDLTMVNVWATDCGYCIKEMPGLGELAKEFKDQGFGILGLLVDGVDYETFKPDQEMVDHAREIVEETEADYPHIVPDEMLAYQIVSGITGTPTSFFVDQEGKLVGGVYGGMMKEDDWRSIIEDTLKEVHSEKNGSEASQ